MRTALLTSAAAMGLLTAVPAQAAVVVNGDGSFTFTGTSGGQASIFFNGVGGEPPAVIPGLSSNLTLTFQSLASGIATFGFSLVNTSALAGASVTSFAFDTIAPTTPNIVGGSSTGTFNTLDVNNNYPVGVGNVEICSTAGSGGFDPNGNACTGGNPGSGATVGSPITGSLTLDFGAQSLASGIRLGNFHDRYQAFTASNGVQSAVGNQVPAVPEPASWAMMLIGFGLLGAAMRRRGQFTQRVRFAL